MFACLPSCSNLGVFFSCRFAWSCAKTMPTSTTVQTMHEIGCIVGLFGRKTVGHFQKRQTQWTQWTQKDMAISGSDLRVVTDGYALSSASTWLGPSTWLAPLCLAPAKDHEYIGRRCKACKAKVSSESWPRKSALHLCFQLPSATPKAPKNGISESSK